MAQFFTVDNQKRLEVGRTVDRSTDYPSHCHDFMASLFPSGTCRWGEVFLLSEPLTILRQQEQEQSVASLTPAIELVFELVRRASYPQVPSRMTSLFCWEAPEEALEFQAEFRQGQETAIYVVEADDFFRADMNLLSLGPTSLTAWSNAVDYWSGKSSSNPCWEILTVPPATVVDKYEA